MSMTWTSKAMHILHIHISTGQMYNTENHDKSAISCKVSTTLLYDKHSLALLVVYVVLYKNKQHSCHLCCCSAGWWWTRRLCPKLSRALAAAAVCVLDVLSTARCWRLQVHYTEQSRASTTPNTPPRLRCSALCGSIQGSRVRNVMLH